MHEGCTTHRPPALPWRRASTTAALRARETRGGRPTRSPGGAAAATPSTAATTAGSQSYLRKWLKPNENAAFLVSTNENASFHVLEARRNSSSARLLPLLLLHLLPLLRLLRGGAAQTRLHITAIHTTAQTRSTRKQRLRVAGTAAERSRNAFLKVTQDLLATAAKELRVGGDGGRDVARGLERPRAQGEVGGRRGAVSLEPQPDACSLVDAPVRGPACGFSTSESAAFIASTK